MAAVAFKKTFQVAKGSAANSGGTFTVDVPVPTDRSVRVEARIGLSNSTDPAKPDGSLYAEGSFANRGGTVTAGTALTGSTNPMSAAQIAAARAESLEAGFIGGGPSTAVWSVSTTNARLTVTNNGTVSADVIVYVDIFTWGSA